MNPAVEAAQAGRSPRLLVAAMSGGVDSSVAAWLMKDAGVEVVGATLRLRSCDGPVYSSACCGVEDAIHARSAAARLGIQHQFLDYRDEFRKIVLERAWSEYACGRTPSPCVLCNRHLKFGRLMQFAADIGADGLVTGHYARIARERDGFALLCGRDRAKDQSYFLFDIPRSALERIWFPLGDIGKAEVRAIARRLGLANAGKRESQDACFGVPGESFAETLRRVLGRDPRPGAFVDAEGRVLGRHAGIHNYTLGQRRGLGLALGRRAYVSAIRPERNEVVISTDESRLLRSELEADEVNWLADRPERAFAAAARIRSTQPAAACEVNPLPGGGFSVRFHAPARAVTPGQAAVIYGGERVLCGGWICCAGQRPIHIDACP